MKLFFNIPDTILVEQGDSVDFKLRSVSEFPDVLISTEMYNTEVTSKSYIVDDSVNRISLDVSEVFYNDGGIQILNVDYCDSVGSKIKGPKSNVTHTVVFIFPDGEMLELPFDWNTKILQDVEGEHHLIHLASFADDVDFIEEDEDEEDPTKDGIEFLLNSADSIKDLAISMSETSSEIESLNTYLKEVEFVEMEKVTNEEDANGKPLYSNDTKRQIQLKKQLAEDEEYNTNKEKLKELQERLKQDSIEIQFLRDKQHNLRVLLPLISNN